MKPIISLSAVALVIIVAVFWYKHPRSSVVDVSDTPNLSQVEVKNLAWNTFSRYQDAAKTHDLVTLSSLSYQLSDICKNSASSSECFARMDEVASSTQSFKASDFINTWYDTKQIILATKWHDEETDLAFGHAREMIYFTRTPTGTPQVLFFTQPEEIVYTLKAKKETMSDWIKELAPRIRDADSDGFEDEVENCSYPNASNSCVKTDPTKRDTDLDGWWDSTESFFYTDKQSKQ